MLEREGDFGRTDLTVVDRVVAALEDEAPGVHDHLMVVGAQCRNIWSAALGRQEQLAVTHDLDLGVAVEDMERFDEVVRALPSVGSTGIAFRVAGLTVDLMPFGGRVEQPRGVVAPPGRSDAPFSVLGFEDVFDGAHRLLLPCGVDVAVATPQGLTALKIAAWHDRSAWFEEKDGQDLGVILGWWLRSPAVIESLWADEGMPLLAACEWDVDRAAAGRWGEQTRALLSEPVRGEIVRQFEAARSALPDVLARARLLPGGQVGATRLIDSFAAGLEGRTG